MARTVLIGGGTLKSTKLFNRVMIRMSGKVKPNVLFILTASRDDAEYLENISKHFINLGCNVNHLDVSGKDVSKSEMKEKISETDIIYIGGGDTEYLISEWNRVGLTELIIDCYKNDKCVLGGISAGAGLFFTSIYSDSLSFRGLSNWDYIMVSCLDIYKCSFCPHYNDPSRSRFKDFINGSNGLCLEDETAFIEENGKYYLIRNRKNAHAYYIDNGNVKELNFLE